MYYRYGADSASAAQPAVSADSVGKLFDDGVITYTQAEAFCKTLGKEFNDEACVAPGSEGTATAMEKQVKADSRATWIVFGGVGLVLWVLFS